MAVVTYADIADIMEEKVSKLFEGNVYSETFHIEFQNVISELSVHVDNGSVISQSVYGRAADFVFSPGEKYVVIEGVELKEVSNVYTHYVQDEGEIDTEQNPLITSDEMAKQLAGHIAAYLKLRNTYQTEYRGNPELEAGDRISIQTWYSDGRDALVLRNELSFNGALHGTVIVKGL